MKIKLKKAHSPSQSSYIPLLRDTFKTKSHQMKSTGMGIHGANAD